MRPNFAAESVQGALCLESRNEIAGQLLEQRVHLGAQRPHLAVAAGELKVTCLDEGMRIFFGN